MVTAIGNAGTMTSEYSEIARRPLEANLCALVVIDIQEKLLPPIFQKEQLIKNSQLLIRLAGVLRMPVLISTSTQKEWAAPFLRSLPCYQKPRPSISRCFPALAAMCSVLC